MADYVPNADIDRREFNDLVLLAAQCCDTPIAAISLIRDEQPFCIAITGLTTAELAHKDHLNLCIPPQNKLTIISNTMDGSCGGDHQRVWQDLTIRFYAGMPLTLGGSLVIGSLCVFDKVPRTLTPCQEHALRLLAGLVSSEMRNAERVAQLERLVQDQEHQSREQRRTIASVRQREMSLHQAVDTMEEGVVLLNPDGTVRLCNRSIERLPSEVKSLFKGKTPLQNVRIFREDGSEVSHADTPVQIALRDGIAQRGVLIGFSRAGDQMVWLKVNAIPLRPAQPPGRRDTDHHQGLIVTLSDVTEQKGIEQSLRESHRFIKERETALRAVLESAPVILFAANSQGTITLFEVNGLAHLGISAGEVIGRSIADLKHGFEEIAANAQRALCGETLCYDVRIGGLRIHTKLQPVRDPAGVLTGMIGICFDVTDRDAAEERFRVLFERSSDAHFIFDEGGIIDCNDEAVRLLHCASKAQLLSLHPAVLSPEFQKDKQRSLVKCLEMDSLARKNGYHRFEWTHLKIDGEEFPVEVTLTPVTLADRPVMLVVWHDLTEIKRAEELIRDHAIVLELQKEELERANIELASRATTDGLTGLKNHRAFQERLTEEIHRSARYGTSTSLILLDVDHFKGFNDRYGHPEGDTVLRCVAGILREACRDSDFAARYGGEEFALILPQAHIEAAAAVAERVRMAIESYEWPIQIVTASFGVACLRLGEETGADLVSRADVALYRAKALGRNHVAISDQAAQRPGSK